MKTFTFVYDPSVSLRKLGSDMLKAARTGKAQIENGISKSPSIKAILSVATENRLSMFQTIVTQKPNSLYELAQLLKKDQAYVLREARALEALGLVELRKEIGEGRERLKPIALYDRIVLDFGMAKGKVG